MKPTFLLACALVALPLAPSSWALPQDPAPASAAGAVASAALYPPGIPKELFDVERVVDGDTFHVHFRGRLEKLRLTCVDTEERLSVDTGSASKPGTVFGETCALWAQDYFAALAGEHGKARVGLYFPDGREQRDAYGRLLCHLILPDGRDFNVLLVEEGKSPYFNKYGNSPVAHRAFVEAQARARAQKKGIWHPDTNVPKTPSAPSARRPYELLLPWWDARAAAIEGFRERARQAPARVVDAEDAAQVKAAAAAGAEVEIFASLERRFDEKNGDTTLLLRSEDKQAAVRVRIPAKSREAFAELDIPHLGDDFRQNYFWVRGKLKPGARGLEVEATEGAQIELAAPKTVAVTPIPVGAGAK